MRKITIGRNNTCDVVIADSSDLVSRKQAVLDCYFWGRMIIHDTSSNGTFVNGQRINNKGTRVKRNDKVTFAQIAKLNWADVKDPYRNLRLTLAAVVMVAVLFFAFFLCTGDRFATLVHLCR